METNAMSPDQIALVQGTFAKIAMDKESVAAAFYARLFETAPALRPLFKGDPKAQGQKLMGALAISVGHLKQPEVLLQPLRDMGARHRGYGVADRDYDTVAQALIWTLESKLGAAFTAEARAAWTAAYDLIADVMKQAPAADAA